MHETTLSDCDRTNNQTESFNNRFSNLVGHNHPTVWTILKKIMLLIAADEKKLNLR